MGLQSVTVPLFPPCGFPADQISPQFYYRVVIYCTLIIYNGLYILQSCLYYFIKQKKRDPEAHMRNKIELHSSSWMQIRNRFVFTQEIWYSWISWVCTFLSVSRLTLLTSNQITGTNYCTFLYIWNILSRLNGLFVLDSQRFEDVPIQGDLSQSYGA